MVYKTALSPVYIVCVLQIGWWSSGSRRTQLVGYVFKPVEDPDCLIHVTSKNFELWNDVVRLYVHKFMQTDLLFSCKYAVHDARE